MIKILAVTKPRIDVYTRNGLIRTKIWWSSALLKSIEMYLQSQFPYLLFLSNIMSEFAGPKSKIPGVSIDRFNGETSNLVFILFRTVI